MVSSKRRHTRCSGEWSSAVWSSGDVGRVFFFQAEDGIRDVAVTGVQTCALPISSWVNTQADLEAIVVIYDPTAGYAVGGGWIPSPPGAYAASPSTTGKVSFGFTSKYFKNAMNPKGQTQFEFKGANFSFGALNFSYLAISGRR